MSVFSACSHAGIVNACLAARDVTPEAPIDLVLGGFHLAGANVEGRIAATVADLADRIDPTHRCPGPLHRMASAGSAGDALRPWTPRPVIRRSLLLPARNRMMTLRPEQPASITSARSGGG